METIILCTISESQLQEGRYVIQIDVFPKEKAGDKLKERKKKGFINKASSFIGGGKSAIFKVKRGSVITFETDGALQPMTKFKEVCLNFFSYTVTYWLCSPTCIRLNLY